MNVLTDLFKFSFSIILVLILSLIFSVLRKDLEWYDLILLDGIRLLPILVAKKFKGCILIGEVSNAVLVGMLWFFKVNLPLTVFFLLGIMTSFLFGLGVYLTKRRLIFIFLLGGLFVLSFFINLWVVIYQDLLMGFQSLFYWV